MPIHGSLFTQYQEQSSPDQFSLQNKKLLKVQMGYGPVWARAGSMVAYQGDIRFENTGSGGLVNGANVLAFSDSISWDIKRIQARGAAMTGGLYNVELRGSGYVAVTTNGEPVALDVSGAPTFGDAQAVVLWTAGVRMDIRVDTGGLRSMVRGGTGETFQMAFGGQGYVLVQPSESVTEGGHQSSSGGGGMLGDLLGG